ncbi:MAG: hypothetical protein HY277_02325 [Ignavibacteriales bacterium]|nr:hypothetical protein [Ignavibacteriales bacterium]
MNHRQTDTEYGIDKDEVLIEESLRGFWDRARAASNLITQLREEKRLWAERLDGLEKEMQSLRTELASRDQELKRLRAEHSQLISSNGHEFFSSEERENLKSKIRDLIAKINSHL